MERVQRDNHTQTLNELKYKLAISKRNISKGREIVRTMVKEKEDLKENLKTAASKVKDLAILEKIFKESLEGALRSQRKLEEDLITLKDELVDTYY